MNKNSTQTDNLTDKKQTIENKPYHYLKKSK